ncbi:hypothetical protein GPALN_016281 [Globodera pallida]|nr:hypothetical protein GPALN_016281 [Globodera pallida]
MSQNPDNSIFDSILGLMNSNIKAPSKPTPPVQPPAEEAIEPQPSTSGTQNAAPLPIRHIILDQDEPLSKGASRYQRRKKLKQLNTIQISKDGKKIFVHPYKK